MTATITASRTTGNDGVLPNRLAWSMPVAMLESPTTTTPMSRAANQDTTPAIAMSRASRQRRATSAATTTSPSAHIAPKLYRRSKNGWSASGSPLISRNRSIWVAPSLPSCAMTSVMSTIDTTTRIRSLVRRRYGSSEAGPNALPRNSAIRLPFSMGGHPTGAYRRDPAFSKGCRSMEVHEHLDALQHEGDLLATAATDVDPDAPVMTVPDLTLRALVHHLGGIHRWAATTVREARSERYDTTLLEVVGAWPDDADLVEWFRTGHRELVDTLRDADPDLDVWHFFAAPTPLAFWARRQTHETAIHRADAQSCSGAVTPYPADLAVDGIDELIFGFGARKHRFASVDPPPQMLLPRDRCRPHVAADPRTGTRGRRRWYRGGAGRAHRLCRRSAGVGPLPVALEPHRARPDRCGRKL